MFERLKVPAQLGFATAFIYLLYSPFVTYQFIETSKALMLHSAARAAVYAVWVAIAVVLNDKNIGYRFSIGFWPPAIVAFLLLLKSSTPSFPGQGFSPDLIPMDIVILGGGVFYGIVSGLFANQCKTEWGALLLGAFISVLQYGFDFVFTLMGLYGRVSIHMH